MEAGNEAKVESPKVTVDGTYFDVGAIVRTKYHGTCKVVKFVNAWIHASVVTPEKGNRVSKSIVRLRKSDLLSVVRRAIGGELSNDDAVEDVEMMDEEKKKKEKKKSRGWRASMRNK